MSLLPCLSSRHNHVFFWERETVFSNAPHGQSALLNTRFIIADWLNYNEEEEEEDAEDLLNEGFFHCLWSWYLKLGADGHS